MIRSITSNILAILDTTPPRVTFIDPRSNETGVPKNKSMTVVFTKVLSTSIPLDKTTLSLKLSDTEVSGNLSLEDNTLLFTPASELKANMIYTISIGNGVIDANGNKLEKEFTYSFMTGNTTDTMPIQVNTTYPVPNANDISLNHKVNVQFSEVPDMRTITSDTFQVSVNGNLVEGNLSFNSYTVVFSPKNNFSPSTVYTVHLKTGIQDTAKNPLASEVSFSFTTGTNNDSATPIVNSVTPANNATNFNPNSGITITFSEPMDISTLNTNTFTIRSANGEAVTGTVAINGSVATFFPSQSLDPNTTYTASASSTTQDMAGNTIQSDYTWSFTTESSSNSIPPSNLAYPTNSFTFSAGASISTITPTVSGSVNTYSISPTLPTGLIFDTTTGTITGTPSATQGTTSYTITASNAYGNTTATISITVNLSPPSNMVYSGSPYTFTQGNAISITPTVSGTVTGCASNLALPTGLVLNATTCAISGTPNATQGATSYTITAGNAYGSTTATISITINPAPYTLGGTLIGLGSGKNIILQNNGGNNLTLNTNGVFTFSNTITSGSSYTITVLTSPSGQTCSVANGTGTINANVNNVVVTCSDLPPSTYTVGGSILGLGSGKTVTLQNNGGDNLSLNENGSFVFSTPVNNGSSYSVSISTPPVGQNCTVTNGSGSSSSNVNNVSVNCVNAYSIGGSIAGLTSGNSVIIQNNGTYDLVINFGTSNFTFTNLISSGTSYSITVKTHPSGKICTITNGSGTVSANVANVSINCTASTLTQKTFYWGTFTDNGNGTIRFIGADIYYGINLTWMKCSQGKTWNSSTNTCTGSADTSFKYCSLNDNSCNSDGTSNPPNTLNGTGNSSAYTTCDTLVFAGFSDWRVPTKREIKTFSWCANKVLPADYSSCGSGNQDFDFTNYFFTQFPGDYFLSSTSYDSTSNWSFSYRDGGFVAVYGSKISTNGNQYVICVRTGL